MKERQKTDNRLTGLGTGMVRQLLRGRKLGQEASKLKDTG